jgi:hypothetical protein
MANSRGEVTVLPAELKRGRKDALKRLIPLAYRTAKPGWAVAKAWMNTQLDMGGSR